MAEVISEIEINPHLRAALMGSADSSKINDGKAVRLRLVLVSWCHPGQVRAPQIVAEISKRKDATGQPVWDLAEGLPLALVLAAIGPLIETVNPYLANAGAETF